MAEPGDLPSNGVNIIIQNKAGHYLLVHDKKQWSLPGGGIKRGETSKRAIIREAYEETGVIVNHLVMIADIQLVINWKHKVILFHTTEWDGIVNPIMKEEITKARFFDPKEIKGNPDIYRAQRIFIEIFEQVWLKLPLPVFAIASDPPLIEW